MLIIISCILQWVKSLIARKLSRCKFAILIVGLRHAVTYWEIASKSFVYEHLVFRILSDSGKNFLCCYRQKCDLLNSHRENNSARNQLRMYRSIFVLGEIWLIKSIAIVVCLSYSCVNKLPWSRQFNAQIQKSLLNTKFDWRFQFCIGASWRLISVAIEERKLLSAVFILGIFPDEFTPEISNTLVIFLGSGKPSPNKFRWYKAKLN